MTPSILTFRQMAFVINAECVDLRDIANIIASEYEEANEFCDFYHKNSLASSLRVVKHYSYIAYSYARSLNEATYSHFMNIISTIFCNIITDPDRDVMNKKWLTNICEDYVSYVRSFR